MKAAVAVQRKLLELMYTLYKKQERYDTVGSPFFGQFVNIQIRR